MLVLDFANRFSELFSQWNKIMQKKWSQPLHSRQRINKFQIMVARWRYKNRNHQKFNHHLLNLMLIMCHRHIHINNPHSSSIQSMNNHHQYLLQQCHLLFNNNRLRCQSLIHHHQLQVNLICHLHRCINLPHHRHHKSCSNSRHPIYHQQVHYNHHPPAMAILRRLHHQWRHNQIQ